MCDESKKTDKEISEETKVETSEETKVETSEETSKPRKGYLLYGMKIGFFTGAISLLISIFITGVVDSKLYGYYWLFIFLTLLFISLIYCFIKYRHEKTSNKIKSMLGIILMILIIIIAFIVYFSMTFSPPLFI